MLYFQEICRQQWQSLPYSAEVTKCRLFRYSKDTRALFSDVWPPTVGLNCSGGCSILHKGIWNNAAHSRKSLIYILAIDSAQEREGRCSCTSYRLCSLCLFPFLLPAPAFPKTLLSTELQVRKSAHRFLLKSYGREMIVIFSLDLETTEWTDNMNLKAVKSHKSWEKCSAQLV